MNTLRPSPATAALGLLAIASVLAFAVVPQPREAAAYPPGGDQQPRSGQLPPGHPPIDQQLPPGHPPIDGQLPPGHPTRADRSQPTPPPPAVPADVESIETIISAYYDSISAPPGEPRDWDRFRSLFIPEGRLIAPHHGQPGTPAVVFAPDQFVRMNAAYFERSGYVEGDIFRRIEAFGHTAHIFSTYETRHSMEDAEPYSRGINSIQLVNDGSRWWIVTVMWDYERPDNPIPAKYLPSHDDTFTGKSDAP